ncbi:hypothetical protein PXW85_27230, partial [Klebsiella pneumoniae]|nr:hypothetical protein [Klebsiella pneumoniae]
QERVGVKRVTLDSGIRLGLGFFLTAHSSSLMMLWLSAGVLVGMAALLFAPLNALTFFAAIACVAFNFGGTITVFPSLVSEF